MHRDWYTDPRHRARVLLYNKDLKKASQGKTTPPENFRVDPRNPNIKQCQSWNDYVMYQIKGTSKNGNPYATYEIVKVMRKKHGNELYVYVVDRLYRSSDVVSACKYMNNLRRRILYSKKL